MIPLKDDLPSRTTPVVTVGLIALNVLAYLYQASLEMSSQPLSASAGAGVSCLRLDPAVAAANPAFAFVCELGAIPCRVLDRCTAPDTFPHPYITILTSMFLHGGVLHLGGNMLYLWIFGNNVEDTLGHGRFLVFYVLSGIGAALAQTFLNASSAIPMVGASGAVSGVLGAYLLLFPYATVLTLVTFGFFIRFIHIPALVVLGFWIVLQFLQGYLSLGAADGGGVAFFAHVGGFVVGMGLLFVMRPRRDARL
jgi:membrane associated rhomboid family serine protease